MSKPFMHGTGALKLPDAANDAFDTDPRHDLPARIEKVAAVAAAHAVAVDRDARFPAEAIEAARSERLLGVLVPREFGADARHAA